MAWNGKSKKRKKTLFPKAFTSHPKIGPKTYENRHQNSWKFDAWGGLGAALVPSGRQGGSRCDLDCLWNSIWRPPGSHLDPKIGQDGAKTHHFGQQFGAFWGSRARSFQKLAKVRKRKTHHHFCLVFEGWRGRLELLGDLFWAILATSWPILADVGFKLGPSCQDVGTKMAKMSQETRLSYVLGSSWVLTTPPSSGKPSG